ncbi:MAG: DUF459 domain-containing protein, partial [Zoogloeaceae bacterium]|nr:DUF459 domain-containing protein [Zoogloeaceae bacterium]
YAVASFNNEYFAANEKDSETDAALQANAQETEAENLAPPVAPQKSGEVPSRRVALAPPSLPAGQTASDLPEESPAAQRDEAEEGAKPARVGAVLEKADSVLFVGDSLMQGVAPHVHLSLFKRYTIHGINLSKQSTGLAYPDFFNWPEQIRKTFQATPGIKLMIVFLGPNDPWDFPYLKGQPYLKFKSEDWENVYRARIREVIEIARENDARVFWLEVPCMRKRELDASMTYLNRLFAEEVKKSGELFLPTSALLGCAEGKFSSFMDADGKKKKSRIDDGVHFTIAGQKRIADEILSFIHIQPEEAAP